jgi:catechol 2,3-dioxygenase-like lactoylglutathione lyase family enzyme
MSDPIQYRVEVVMIPVSDVDRAKQFYTETLGFPLDGDFEIGEGMRFVQVTPPGSSCSIAFGTKLTDAAPGSYRETYIVVSDIEAARAELVARGAEVDHHSLVRQLIGINRICARMLQHFPNNTFTSCNIPREADNIFVGPTTHGCTSEFL